MRYILAVLAVFLTVRGVEAHPGGLNASGCHNNRKTGEYHCHRAPQSQAPVRPQALLGSGSIYYPNCSAARAAGAAPIRVGQPGYGGHLDRDGDGVVNRPGFAGGSNF
jgi:hypothetical protein